MLWILGCIYFLNHCQVLVLDRQMNHFQGLDKQRRSGSVQCRRLWFNPWVRKLPWRREWLSTPVFLPGEFQGQRSLAGQSMGSQRIGHNSATNTFTFTTYLLSTYHVSCSEQSKVPAFRGLTHSVSLAMNLDSAVTALGKWFHSQASVSPSMYDMGTIILSHTRQEVEQMESRRL